MASLMRALIIDDTKSASVRHVPVPVPGPRQVVVDVHRAGVCGTDVELFTRELPYFEQGKSSFPLCPGHEWCGTVSAIGAEVDPRWIGERVTGDTMLGCGHCPRCASGRHHVCADRSEIGIAGWPGALAEKLLVPVGSLYRLPAGRGEGRRLRLVRVERRGPLGVQVQRGGQHPADAGEHVRRYQLGDVPAGVGRDRVVELAGRRGRTGQERRLGQPRAVAGRHRVEVAAQRRQRRVRPHPVAP